ncbi:uncharacterized protein LOC106081356 [Stomoxys calcitrans]|uniref:uncharacterized protein LOC106081356 n=1 Tax=Stomoxys calcitrans TaxID=35570 RepID=UPI0027E21BEA|nr:uncharacterized protein LOC106081356 [Stomoxys calcitrans]
MASHSGRSFINSCLKVPIDPCNNCPAPIYNRPRMYLGRLSMTPTTALATKTCDTATTDLKWSCGGIRSLTKFYDSIPDYGELTHLTEEEFYSTLDTLRSTCREFRTTPANSCGIATTTIVLDDRCSTSTTSSSMTSHCHIKKSKKGKKKKKSNKSKTRSENQSESQESESIVDYTTNNRSTVPDSAYTLTDSKTFERIFDIKSIKKDLDEEVERFRKSLKDYESELRRPATSSVLNRSESRSFTRSPSKERREKSENVIRHSNEKVPVRSTFTSTLRERLRKTLSFNDLNSLADPTELAELRNKTKTLEKLAFKGNSNAYQDPSKLSNYFQETTKPELSENVPQIVVETPTTDSSTERTEDNKRRNKSKTKEDKYKIPFKIFDLDSSKKTYSAKHSSPSPVHPVARPNLAATLRVECSRKKVKELKNNCTYYDKTPQIDWEVRKTPAWKSLSLNETHQEIIKLRLATRKAEQALQKREYDLNMELMRQRVKSAPLLLEGPTHWGPDVGKLTHNCQREGRRHMCQTNQRTRRKKNSSRSHSCRRGLFHHSDPGIDYERFAESSPMSNDNKSQESGRMSQKINTLRKVYGGGANSAAKSQSRCSTRPTNTPHSSKSNAGKRKTEEKNTTKSNPNLVVVENDSGDELSSLDRAFL